MHPNGFSLGGIAASLSENLSKSEIENCREAAAQLYEAERKRDELALIRAILSGNESQSNSYLKDQLHNADANYSLLQLAIVGGFEKIAKNLISNCVDINQADCRGDTALHLTTYGYIADSKSLITSLIEAGADIDSLNNEGFTPLLCAALNRKTEIGRLLVGAGADIEAKDEYGETPLQIAVSRNCPDFVKLMISAGAELNLKNRSGQTSLAHSKKNGFREISRLLTNAGCRT